MPNSVGAGRRDGILAFHRLNVPATLNVTFLSTNHIANVMGTARGTIGRVCRWHDDTNQVARWMGVALLRAQSGFKRVRGRRQLGKLAAFPSNACQPAPQPPSPIPLASPSGF